MTAPPAATEEVLPGVHVSAPERLPFATDVEIRSFLLRRDRGNLLVYSTTGVAPALPVARQYLNHRHEAMFMAGAVDAPLFTHRDERASVAKVRPVRATFTRRHGLDDDFEAIPTPGHTSGATAYLWDGGDDRLLFTGDTIYLRDGDWVAAVLEGSSDRAAYLTSLALIRELDFDVLVPWAATRGQPFYARTSQADARRRIDAIIRRVRAGADH